MDFRFTPEEENFRREVRDFLERDWPQAKAQAQEEAGGELSWAQRAQVARAFEKKLAAKGWLAMAWPKEYGGGGRSFIEQMIYKEELAYHGAPGSGGQGIGYVGPCILTHGTEEQKRQHIPPILNADVNWCQGFSEPNAGSDLASLQTRAVEDGDDYLISGQKIWTSGAHTADWCHLLARTDPDAPKHRGISYFLIDMKSPGITIRPLINMAGRHGFNEVFWDNVRVPNGNMLGEKNRGWYAATYSLDFERSSAVSVAQCHRELERMVTFAGGTGPSGRRPADDLRTRHRLAELAIEVQTARILSYRVVWLQMRGDRATREAAMNKLYISELNQRLADVGMWMVGMYGLLEWGSKWAPLKAHFENAYLHIPAQTVGAGTSEIQRNVIATRGLGLPR